jgi:hypothetical protein
LLAGPRLRVVHRVASLSIILVLCFPALASAARPSKLSPAAAMRSGIRVFAGSNDIRATASRIHVTCKRWTRVGQTRPCTGSFRLTRHGRHADYHLTRHAGTFLNTPNSVMYVVAARAARSVAGLPIDTGKFSGFYPR